MPDIINELLAQLEDLKADAARYHAFAEEMILNFNGAPTTAFIEKLAEILEKECPMDDEGNHPPLTIDMLNDAIDMAMIERNA